jgi:hypothetical protein
MTVLLGHSEEWKAGSLHFVCMKMEESAVMSGLKDTILDEK